MLRGVYMSTLRPRAQQLLEKRSSHRERMLYSGKRRLNTGSLAECWRPGLASMNVKLRRVRLSTQRARVQQLRGEEELSQEADALQREEETRPWPAREVLKGLDAGVLVTGTSEEVLHSKSFVATTQESDVKEGEEPVVEGGVVAVGILMDPKRKDHDSPSTRGEEQGDQASVLCTGREMVLQEAIELGSDLAATELLTTQPATSATVTREQCHVSSATSDTVPCKQCHVSSATSAVPHQQCHISSATSAVPRQQCHVSSATSAVPRQTQCHISSATSAVPCQTQCHVSSATSAVPRQTVPRKQCHVSNMTGLPGQLPNQSLAAYKQRFQAQIEAEEQRQLAAEAARVQAEEAAAAEQLRLQADADADAQARRKEAEDLLQRHEASSIDRLEFWHFEPNGDDPTPEEKHKEFLSKLVTRLLYTCNYQRSELEKQYQDLTQASPESIPRDSTSWSRLEELDLLTFTDFQWMPVPSTGRLPKPHCNVLMAQLRDYLHAVVPTPLMDVEVEVVDLYAHTAKIDREFKTQRYDDIDAPLLYVRIQNGEATCSALIDCGATRNYISQDFMVRAGLVPRVRRKSQPTQVTLADDHTHKSIDRCIDDVPVYFAPHASEAVSFDILDTKFDMILGMSWLRSKDHPVNFFNRTVHVRDRNGVLVPCTVPLPHLSISCHAVSAANMRVSIIRDDIEEMGVCFLHALPPRDASSTDSSSDPRITELLDAYRDVFEGSHGVVPDRPIRHEIILEDGAVPPRGCIYRMSEEELSVLCAQLDDLLEKGWIRPTSSPYVRNADPLPRIDDLLERLGGAKFFSKLDLKSGYHQLEIRKKDRYKTAFKTRYGHFEWLVMPFGLTNTPATFQAAMTMEFRHMLDRYVLIYLDDILVYSRSLEEHVEHLHTVLERLRQAKYKANRDKCEFARQELEYLGHYVTPQGIRLLADKIEALRVRPEPTNTTDVRSFMGLGGYYQRFINGYSRIVAPMTRLQSPKVPFVFDDDTRRSFQAFKTTMLMAPVLCIYDPTLPTRVTTDASRYGIGVVLEQHDGDDSHPVEYFSHKVSPIKSLDDARKKELLAFIMTLKRWRHFLLGRRRLTWVTENNPLTYYKTQDTVSSTIGRLMYFIDQFDFTPKHLPGLSNCAADALSRRPDLCAMTHHAFAFDEELQRHFIRAYQFDPDFGTLYAQLSSDHPPASHYCIVDGYLLLHSRGKDLLCVPRNLRLRTRLLGKYHDSRLAGDFGVNRTIARLRQRFRWPDLITDVTQYCDSCEVCRRSKPRNRNPYGELHPMPIPREPGLSIAMDVTGPFPRDRLGHDGILTVVDRLSKYARFLPCKYHSTAPELARLLHMGWICGYSVLEDIVSDRNTRFMSAFWTALMQESGITMKPSSAWHPQTDGQTERAHQTSQMMLRTLIRSDLKDWVDRLPDIEFAYNTSVHPAIGVTPFELHHGGRKGRIFADLLLPRPADIDVACSLASVRKHRELLTQARANMQKAQVRMQQQANRRHVPCPIRASDLVWVSAEEFALEQDVSRKLLPTWFGPWSVTAAAGDERDGPSFVINIREHMTVHPVFHASKLATYTPAESDDFPGRRSQDPPSMDGHQEVDRVISDRKYGSKPRQYKVTFKACDRDDTRWISGADLKASAPLINAHYEKRRLAQEASRQVPPTRTVVPPSDRQLRPRSQPMPDGDIAFLPVSSSSRITPKAYTCHVYLLRQNPRPYVRHVPESSRHVRRLHHGLVLCPKNPLSDGPLSNTKVRYKDPHLLPGAIAKKQVAALDVPVDDRGIGTVVKVGQALDDLQGDAQSLHQRQRWEKGSSGDSFLSCVKASVHTAACEVGIDQDGTISRGWRAGVCSTCSPPRGTCGAWPD
ncbi:hypothetical protein CBR_g23631 [Chara braunii]|uniref:Integrase catalytic domain-containing protein n=1 Tax=Chara braunii TaxID=69332 RepID=A0A388L4R8_CHABU|nr:hypothetical protein CBR_g23631 [Chara braunii]|eukprot:GBG77301.1 hypothetical protein CBR_g23631 [Chara braunii]